MPRDCRRGSFVRADAKMKMRRAKSNGEITVERSKIGRRRGRMELRRLRPE